jgi:hypothetical protein
MAKPNYAGVAPGGCIDQHCITMARRSNAATNAQQRPEQGCSAPFPNIGRGVGRARPERRGARQGDQGLPLESRYFRLRKSQQQRDKR